MLPSGTSAFGLSVRAELPVAGIDGPAPPAPDVVLELDHPWWDPADATVLSDLRFDDGRPALRVEAGPGATWRFWGHGYGEAVAVVGDGGARVGCAPTDPAVFARLLHGQVLPFLSGQRGFELLHACAITGRRGATLVCGPSGAGKSTLLRALLARGAGFLADDAVAIDAAGMAWAGPGVIGPELEPAVVAAPSAPVRRVVLLARGGDRVALEPVADARVLLGLGYDALEHDPGRQVRRLDRLSALAAAVELLRLHVPEGAVDDAAACLLAS